MGSTANDAFTTTAVLHNISDMTTVTMLASKGGKRKDYPTEDFHYPLENCDSIADKQYQLLPDHVDSTLKGMAVAAPHHGSFNVVGMLVECNTGGISVNRSVSGSNIGSNGLNGSGTVVDDRGTSIEGNNGVVGNNGIGGASWNKSGSGNRSDSKVDQNKASKREVSLSKFRYRRKESCIHKQVINFLVVIFGNQFVIQRLTLSIFLFYSVCVLFFILSFHFVGPVINLKVLLAVHG